MKTSRVVLKGKCLNAPSVSHLLILWMFFFVFRSVRICAFVVVVLLSVLSLFGSPSALSLSL
jgi:hypothetical protein